MWCTSLFLPLSSRVSVLNTPCLPSKICSGPPTILSPFHETHASSCTQRSSTKTKTQVSSLEFKQGAAGPASVPAWSSSSHSATYLLQTGCMPGSRDRRPHVFGHLPLPATQQTRPELSLRRVASRSSSSEGRSPTFTKPVPLRALRGWFPSRKNTILQHGDWGKCHRLSLPFCLSLQLLNYPARLLKQIL